MRPRDDARRARRQGCGEATDGSVVPASPLRAACAALLPWLGGVPLDSMPGDSLRLQGWHVQEVERTGVSARVTIGRTLQALEDERGAPPPVVRPYSTADLLWEPSGGPAAAGRGTWLLTHVDDPRQDLAWDVYCAPGGHTWRMLPRYTPEWLRERERVVMALLRGALPLPDDPVAAATAGTPVWLEPFQAVVQDQERDRAAVAYHADPAPGVGAQPHYVVRLRRRRLSLRPYRSVGFWLVEAVARQRQAGER